MKDKANIESLKIQIEELREELHEKIEENINDLSSAEVLEVNDEIDQLLVKFIKATMT